MIVFKDHYPISIPSNLDLQDIYYWNETLTIKNGEMGILTENIRYETIIVESGGELRIL